MTKSTTNHQKIREWVQERGGYPATVEETMEGDEPGVLRIDFPGYSGEESLKRISWEEFFRKFDKEELAFLYQEQTQSGEMSRFFKFVDKETAEEAT
ncbi:MAG: hypothetical protein ACLFU8_14500 [Anaerolineales bacterium]